MMAITEGKALYHKQPHEILPLALFQSPRLPEPLTRAPILHSQGGYGCTITQNLLRKRTVQGSRTLGLHIPAVDKEPPHFPGSHYL